MLLWAVVVWRCSSCPDIYSSSRMFQKLTVVCSGSKVYCVCGIGTSDLKITENSYMSNFQVSEAYRLFDATLTALILRGSSLMILDV